MNDTAPLTEDQMREEFADMRRRVADGEPIPREELTRVVINLRTLRQKATTPKAKAAPVNLNELFSKPKS